MLAYFHFHFWNVFLTERFLCYIRGSPSPKKLISNPMPPPKATYFTIKEILSSLSLQIYVMSWIIFLSQLMQHLPYSLLSSTLMLKSMRCSLRSNGPDLDCYPVAHQERYLYFKRIFSFPKLCESHLLFRGIASQVLNWQGEQLWQQQL